MKIFTPTCPSWCDQEHAPSTTEVDGVGHIEHGRKLQQDGVSVDLVQFIEWQHDAVSAKWMVTTHPPTAVLGTEFDNAESMGLAELGARMRVLEKAHRELADLILQFNGEGS